MGLPIKETVYLRDIHRWSAKEHAEWKTNFNKAVLALQGQKKAAVKILQANDEAGSRSTQNVTSTLPKNT
jgi:hypothetical protein